MVEPKVEEPKVNETPNLNRLEAANKEKKELLDREDEQLNRKETILAEEKAGGQASAGQEEKPKFSKEELAANERVMAVGRAGGAAWAKKKE